MFEVLMCITMFCLFMAVIGLLREVRNIKDDTAHAIYLLEERETR